METALQRQMQSLLQSNKALPHRRNYATKADKMMYLRLEYFKTQQTLLTTSIVKHC